MARPPPGFAGGSKGAEPTNWGSAFSGPAWTLDATTLLVLANLSDEPADAGELPDAEVWRKAEAVLDSGVGDVGSWELRPWEARARRLVNAVRTE